MRKILSVVVVLAVVAILVVDGLGMYAAHRIAVEVAEASAREAARVYVATQGSEAAADKLVQSIAKEADVVVIAADYHSGTTRWYQVTIQKEPDTHVLGRIPYVRDLLAQESTALAHF